MFIRMFIVTHMRPDRGSKLNLGVCPDQNRTHDPYVLWDNASHTGQANTLYFKNTKQIRNRRALPQPDQVLSVKNPQVIY